MVLINSQLSKNIKPVDIKASYIKVRHRKQGNLFSHFGGQTLNYKDSVHNSYKQIIKECIIHIYSKLVQSLM